MTKEDEAALIKASWDAWIILRRFEDRVPGLVQIFDTEIDPFNNESG